MNKSCLTVFLVEGENIKTKKEEKLYSLFVLY
jgi:hypothetical protein